MEFSMALLNKVGIPEKANIFPTSERRAAAAGGHCKSSGHDAEGHAL